MQNLQMFYWDPVMFAVLNDIPSVSKTELEFSLTLCNTICDQYVIPYVIKLTMRLKNSFSNH